MPYTCYNKCTRCILPWTSPLLGVVKFIIVAVLFYAIAELEWATCQISSPVKLESWG